MLLFQSTGWLWKYFIRVFLKKKTNKKLSTPVVKTFLRSVTKQDLHYLQELLVFLLWKGQCIFFWRLSYIVIPPLKDHSNHHSHQWQNLMPWLCPTLLNSGFYDDRYYLFIYFNGKKCEVWREVKGTWLTATYKIQVTE